MNLENELNIIQELLKIPLNKIEINGTQIIKIYSSNIYVGDIKYYSNLMRLVTGIVGGFSMGIIIWKIIDLIIKNIIK